MSGEPLPHRLAADQHHLPLSYQLSIGFSTLGDKCMTLDSAALLNPWKEKVREGVSSQRQQSLSFPILAQSSSKRTSEPRRGVAAYLNCKEGDADF